MGMQFFEGPSGGGGNLHNKLTQHIRERSYAAFDHNAQIRAQLHTPADLEAYTADIRQKYLAAIGGVPYDPTLPLHAEITGRIPGDVFDIEKVIYQSRPGVYITANLYIPHRRRTPCGAVLFSLGHSNEGKVYTRYQGVARSIASAGLIVLVPDPVGQGERHSYVESVGEMTQGCTSDHQYAGHQVMLTGDAPVRWFIADARRSVDYLLTRPEVDPDAIGITGSSGGGTMTCNLMVCEPRAKAAAPGTFLTTRKAILETCQPQDAEQIWLNMPFFDHHDVLLCFCPKPVLVLADDADFFPIEGTVEAMDVARRFYEMYARPDDLAMALDHSTHAFTEKLAADAAAFFARTLNGETRGEVSSVIDPLPEEMLLCTPTGQVSTSYPDARFIFHENYDRTAALAETATASDAAAFVREKIDAFRVPCRLRLREYPARVSAGTVGRSYFWYTQEQMGNQGVLLRSYENDGKTLPVVVCLFDRGTNALNENAMTLRTITRGAAAFIVDLAGIGESRPDAYDTRDIHGAFGTVDTMAKNLFMLGDSLAALRLWELERAMEVAKLLPGAGAVQIYARGNMGILAKLYALVHPEVRVEAVETPMIAEQVMARYYEDYDMAGYMLPGIGRYAVKLGF